jgi:hypothetical protein
MFTSFRLGFHNFLQPCLQCGFIEDIPLFLIEGGEISSSPSRDTVFHQTCVGL